MTVNGSGPHGAVRVLVCGSREWTDRDAIYNFLAFLTRDNVVIHGAARGADSIAAEAAGRRGAAVVAFPAEWDKHGKAAGPIRNQRMLDEGKPDVVIAFGVGRGTGDMIRRAGKAGVPVYQIVGSVPQQSGER